jgi:hypothetical protein
LDESQSKFGQEVTLLLQLMPAGVKLTFAASGN